MEGLRSTPGFWGPSLLADITLVVEILFYLALCAGVVAQLQRKYKWHDRFQIPVVVLNIFFIIFVMVPTFTDVAGELPSGISQPPILVTTLHGIFGTIAQGLAIYCLLAGLKILPRKIGVLRYWMWAAFSFWTLTIILGIGTYIFFYAGGDTTVVVADLSAEHDAELAAEPTLPPAAPEGEEVVAEHDEEAPPPEAAAPTEPPAEAAVEEHAEEVLVEATEAPEVTEPPVAEGEAEETTAEHAEEVVTEAPTEAPPPTAVTAPPLQGVWLPLQPINEAPNARYDHTVALDPNINHIYLFGGRNGDQVKDDTWVFDPNRLSWNFLAGQSPTAPVLHSAVMVLDQEGLNLYIGTGQGLGGQVYNDVWKLDLTSQIWENLGTGTGGAAPEPRYGGPGGNLGGNLVVTHGFGNQRYDDTWRFNLETTQWEDISPAGPRPLPRCLFAAAPLEGNLVIQGGCAAPGGPCFLDDTWVLDTTANVWREVLSDVKPAGRQYHTLVAGAEPNQVILFGGQDANQAPLGDVWVLDVNTGVWQPVEVPDGGPSPRYSHSATWVPGQGMIIFGGRNNEGALNDMWLLTLQPATTDTAAPEAEPTLAPAEPTATPVEPTPVPAEPTPTPPPAEPTPTPELISEHDGD